MKEEGQGRDCVQVKDKVRACVCVRERVCVCRERENQVLVRGERTPCRPCAHVHTGRKIHKEGERVRIDKQTQTERM